jgi:hypothetical protein
MLGFTDRLEERGMEDVCNFKWTSFNQIMTAIALCCKRRFGRENAIISRGSIDTE